MADRHRVLLDLNNAIITNLTEETLFRAICVALRRIIHFDQAGLTLYEQEKEAMRVVALDGTITDHFTVGMLLPLVDPVTGLAYDFSSQQIHVDLEKEISHPIDQQIYESGTRSYIIAPLKYQGHCWGTLGVGSRSRHRYTTEDLEFLQEVANQVAIAIANMRAYEEIMALSEREASMAERRRTLLEINNAIISHLTQDELLRAIVPAVQRVIPFDSIGISVFEPEQQAFRLAALAGSSQPGSYHVGQVIPMEQSAAVSVLESQRPFLVRDLEQERVRPFENILYEDGFRSFLVVPLLAQGKTIGTIGVTSRNKEQYSEADAGFLQEVANQIALSLQNSRLYEEMRQEATQRRRTEEMLRAITEGTAAATGVDFFWSLARHLATALQLRFALVAECIGRLTGRVRTLAFWQGDHFGRNFEYDVADTPCKGAVEGRICYYPNGIQKLFPGDVHLRELGAESYLGVTIFDREGQPTGHLAVMDDRPMQDEPWRVSVLRTFAARAGAEMERLRAEADLRIALDEVESLKNRLQAENLYLQEEIRTEHNFEDIIGNSPSLQAVLRQVRMIAPTDSTVLILGETGTGKELIARAIHDSSTRKDRPLVKVNCGAISAGLVESELFGHTRGAFTGAIEKRVGRFELADGGTLFLDEVGELPPDTQVRLLRVLQEGEFEPVGSSQTRRVDVRIIAATNRNLDDEVRAGRFRADLYYRLNVLPVHLPPLRERMEDLPRLVMFFLSRFARNMGRRINGLSQETMERLRSHTWPGNVRELQNVIERAVVMTSGNMLALERAFEPVMLHNGHAQTNGHQQTSYAAAEYNSSPAPAIAVLRPLREVERDHILSVLEGAGWVVEGAKGAARILNLNPNTLRSRMKKLGIHRPGQLPE